MLADEKHATSSGITQRTLFPTTIAGKAACQKISKISDWDYATSSTVSAWIRPKWMWLTWNVKSLIGIDWKEKTSLTNQHEHLSKRHGKIYATFICHKHTWFLKPHGHCRFAQRMTQREIVRYQEISCIWKIQHGQLLLQPNLLESLSYQLGRGYSSGCPSIYFECIWWAYGDSYELRSFKHSCARAKLRFHRS